MFATRVAEIRTVCATKAEFMNWMPNPENTVGNDVGDGAVGDAGGRVQHINTDCRVHCFHARNAAALDRNLSSGLEINAVRGTRSSHVPVAGDHNVCYDDVVCDSTDARTNTNESEPANGAIAYRNVAQRTFDRGCYASQYYARPNTETAGHEVTAQIERYVADSDLNARVALSLAYDVFRQEVARVGPIEKYSSVGFKVSLTQTNQRTPISPLLSTFPVVTLCLDRDDRTERRRFSHGRVCRHRITRRRHRTTRCRHRISRLF